MNLTQMVGSSEHMKHCV